MLDWQNLRLGDRVVISEWPPELHKEKLHAETIELYEWLIASKRPLTVVKVDMFGIPYGRVEREVNIVEYLGLNHGGLQYIQ